MIQMRKFSFPRVESIIEERYNPSSKHHFAHYPQWCQNPCSQGCQYMIYVNKLTLYHTITTFNDP